MGEISDGLSVTLTGGAFQAAAARPPSIPSLSAWARSVVASSVMTGIRRCRHVPRETTRGISDDCISDDWAGAE